MRLITKRRGGGRWRTIVALLSLAVLLGACGGEGLGQSRGTAIVALAEPTNTPTVTPVPTNTPPPTATATPRTLPTATRPLPTATRPLPTATAIRPTATRPRNPNSLILDFSRWDTGNSDPAGKWRRSHNAATGEYTVQVLEDEQEWSFYSPDTQQFLDFRLDVEARRGGGPDGTGYGLVFRRQPRQANQEVSERYVFFITSQGYYGIFHTDGANKRTWIQNLTPPPAGIIRVGAGKNKLSVVCRGASVQLLVNDRVVYENANLKLVAAGGIGIFASSAENSAQSTSVIFENIVLTNAP